MGTRSEYREKLVDFEKDLKAIAAVTNADLARVSREQFTTDSLYRAGFIAGGVVVAVTSVLSLIATAVFFTLCGLIWAQHRISYNQRVSELIERADRKIHSKNIFNRSTGEFKFSDDFQYEVIDELISSNRPILSSYTGSWREPILFTSAILLSILMRAYFHISGFPLS